MYKSEMRYKPFRGNFILVEKISKSKMGYKELPKMVFYNYATGEETRLISFYILMGKSINCETLFFRFTKTYSFNFF